MLGDAFVLRVVDGPGHGHQRVVNRPMTIGRDNADFDLGSDPRADHAHARVTPDAGGLILEDLGSRHGTTFDGQRLSDPTVLDPGASIRIGSSTLVVLRVEPAVIGGSTPTASIELVEVGVAPRVLPRAPRIVIGRDPDRVDVHVGARSVSREHCALYQDGPDLSIEDLGSTRGTFVNGRRVDTGTRCALADGDRVGLADGGVFLRVSQGTDVDDDGDRSVQIRLRREDEPRAWNVDLEAPPRATTAEVVARATEYLGLPATSRWCCYNRSTGALLAPTNRWAAAPVRRGDEIVVGPVSEAVVSPEGAASGPFPRDEPVAGLPRALHAPPPYRPVLPNVPEGTTLRGRGLGWQITAGLAGLAGGLLIGVLGGRPEYLVFGGVFAVAGLLSLSAGIFGDQSRRRFRVKQFSAHLRDLDAELAEVNRQQADTLRQLAPPVDQVSTWLRLRGDRLWERRPTDADFLALRLGSGSRPALVEVDSRSNRDSELAPQLDAVVDRHRILSDVPVVLPGRDTHVVALVGHDERCESMARSLLIQAAALHSPHELGLAVLDPAGRWREFAWLPHAHRLPGNQVSRDAQSTRTVADQLLDLLPDDTDRRHPALPDQLVLVTAAALAIPAVRDVVERASTTPWVVIVIAGDERSVVPGTSIVVQCNEPEGSVTGFPGEAAVPFTPEWLDDVTARRLALGAAPLTDPRSPPDRRSRALGLLELLGIESLDTFDPEVLWAQGGRSLRAAPIGVADDGTPLTIDLRRDGPHGLLAGTTGSGKSQFLLTLIASLALTNPPDLLNFFLADYKGGAAFRPVAGLPHTVGFVSDLEPAMLGRALRSLEAEMLRRKQLLDAADVEDLAAYERLGGAREPIPTLFVVVDEYAALVKELRETSRDSELRRFGAITTQGRSLGVHLLLSMQSPEGIVQGDIDRNTNLRLCLHVLKAEESVEMIGRPDALAITRPGRGYERLGGSTESVTGFQTGLITRPLGHAEHSTATAIAPYADDPRDPTLTDVVDTGPVSDDADRPPTELDLVATRLTEAAARRGAAPRHLWLPPLPLRVESDDLPHQVPAEVTRTRLVARLGLADLPGQQRQTTQPVDLSAAANVLVLGEFGAGKTTALNQVALDLAERYAPSDLHLYAIDAGNASLGPLGRLPHTAGVIAADDTERLDRLSRRLERTLDERRSFLTRDGSGDWLAWRERSAERPPWIVIFVDDYVAFRDTSENFEFGVLMERFHTILRSGPGVGIHVVLATTQPADLRMSINTLFGERLLLRLADSSEYLAAGIRGPELAELELPPGRALVGGPPARPVQIAWPTDERRAAAASAWHPSPGAPRAIGRLPLHVELGEVLAHATPLRHDQVVIGVGGEEVEAVVLDHQVAGPHLVVLGNDRSGRSTTLRSCIDAASAAASDARFGIVTCRQSPLEQLRDDPRVAWIASNPADIGTALDELVASLTVSHLVIDDADLLPPGTTSSVEQLLRKARDRGLRVYVAARAADFSRSFEGWVQYLISMRVALLLSPTPEEASSFDLRVRRGIPAIAGRGFLVVRERSVALQVATSGATPDPTGGGR